MTAHHLHLAINHLSIIGIPIITLLLVIFLKLKNEQAVKILLLCLTLTSFSTGLIYLTGEPAEHSLESFNKISNLPEVNESLIEPHEEAGELALYFSLALGVFSIIAFVLKKQRKILIGIVIIFSILASATLIRVANLGGKISHPELRT